MKNSVSPSPEFDPEQQKSGSSSSAQCRTAYDHLLSVTIALAILLMLSYACMSSIWGNGNPSSMTHCSMISCKDVGGQQHMTMKNSHDADTPTDLRHIVFAIASNKKAWPQRRNHVNLWWNPSPGAVTRRGFVWLDEVLESDDDDDAGTLLPEIRVSENVTSRFKYSWPGGNPSAIRISRIFAETLRQELPDVRWLVMGDDDTIFFPENLALLLRQYDHRKFYYIGQPTESQIQSSVHSHDMAFGGGGFALSLPLAKAMAEMYDSCLHRYPRLYGSDSRIQVCAAELGVPLTRAPGFHQIDLHGNIFGFLAAHPVAPLISLHHVDSVDPIFPNKDKESSLRHLIKASEPDPAGLLQQSICYDTKNNVTISVSWGYVVRVMAGTVLPTDVQTPAATFKEWRTWRSDSEAFTFDVQQPLPAHEQCSREAAYFFEDFVHDAPRGENVAVAGYRRHAETGDDATCRRLLPRHDVIVVHKERQDESWIKAPMRQCCEVSSTSNTQYTISVRHCKEGEVITP